MNASLSFLMDCQDLSDATGGGDGDDGVPSAAPTRSAVSAAGETVQF